MSVTLPSVFISSDRKAKYNKLWTNFIGEHLNCIPQDVEKIILINSPYKTLQEFFESEYEIYYREKYIKT